MAEVAAQGEMDRMMEILPVEAVAKRGGRYTVVVVAGGGVAGSSS